MLTVVRETREIYITLGHCINLKITIALRILLPIFSNVCRNYFKIFTVNISKLLIINVLCWFNNLEFEIDKLSDFLVIFKGRRHFLHTWNSQFLDSLSCRQVGHFGFGRLDL